MDFYRSVVSCLWFLHGIVVGTWTFLVLHINFSKFWVLGSTMTAVHWLKVSNNDKKLNKSRPFWNRLHQALFKCHNTFPHYKQSNKKVLVAGWLYLSVKITLCNLLTTSLIAGCWCQPWSSPWSPGSRSVSTISPPCPPTAGWLYCLTACWLIT